MAVQAYAHSVIRWRWPVLLGCVLAVLGVASGLRTLEFTADYRVFLDEENPELAAFEAHDIVQFILAYSYNVA